MLNVILPTLALFLGLIVLSILYLEREGIKTTRYSIIFTTLYTFGNTIAFVGIVAPDSSIFTYATYFVGLLPALIPTLLLHYAIRISEIKYFSSTLSQTILFLIPGVTIILDILYFSSSSEFYLLTSIIGIVYLIGALLLGLFLIKIKPKLGTYYVFGVLAPLLLVLGTLALYTNTDDILIYITAYVSIYYLVATIIAFSMNGVLLPKSIFVGRIRTQVYITFITIATTIILLATFLSFKNAITTTNTSAINEVELLSRGHLQALETYLTSNQTAFGAILENKELLSVAESNTITTETKDTLLHEMSELVTYNSGINAIRISFSDKTSISTSEIPQFISVAMASHGSSHEMTLVKDKMGTFYSLYTYTLPNNSISAKNTTVEFVTSHELLQAVIESPKTNFDTTQMYIISAEGHIITNIQSYPDGAFIGKSIQNDQVMATCAQSLLRVKSEDDSPAFETSLFGTNKKILVQPIPSHGLCLVVSINTQEIENNTRKTLGIIMVISLISMMLVTIAADMLGRFIATPIVKLTTDMGKASAGDFKHRSAIQLDNEIGTLASSFNVMVTELQDLYNTFESKVTSQTKDLTDQRDILVRQQKQMVNILSDLEDEKSRTELLASQLKKFELAVQNSTDHIVITDPNGVILYANNAVKTITGFTPEDVIGQKVGSRQNWGGQMPAEFYKKMWKTIAVDKKPFQGELVNKRKSGALYNVYASITPIVDAKNELQFFVAIERDITREKDIDRVKTEFVSLASHQLRTPLSAINWYTEMLLDEDAGALTLGQKEYLSEIYNGTKRMIDLVGALLNVSRLELGSFSIEPETLDIIDLSEQAIKEMTPLAASKKVKIVRKFAKPAIIMSVDKKLMYIILQNILSNAIKYNRKGGTVTFDISRNTRNLTIKISDTGMGIPETEKEHVFEKLFRASNAREKVIEGTGLGLYIIKSILEAVGGSITFDSVLDKGTTFIIKLPAKGMNQRLGAKKLEGPTI